MDPTTTPAAPAAAVTPTPAAPAAPAAPAQVVEPKPTNPKLLSTILGLTKPEEVPVAPAKPVEPAKAPETPAAPAAEVPKTPETPPPAAPKPAVKRKETPPALTVEEARRIAAEEAAKVRPAPAAAPAAPTPAAPDDSDLSDAEREELEIAELAEKKDPSRKGLASKYRDFYRQEKEFISRKLTSEGEGYDPAADPDYKKFVDRSAPKLSAAERKALREEKLIADAEARAVARTKSELTPVIEGLQRKQTELEYKPVIKARVETYATELEAGMPEDIVKFYNENGRDEAKAREVFPEEFDIVKSTITGAAALASEALSLRRGVTAFDQKNPRHQFLETFVDSQAKHLLAQPAVAQVRDGKTFVHPYNWKPEMEGKHWTFDDEDMLGMLRSVAQKEAKDGVSAHRERVRRSQEAAARRTAAPTGAPTPPSAPPPVEPSTRTPPATLPGAAAPGAKPKSVLSNLLDL